MVSPSTLTVLPTQPAPCLFLPASAGRTGTSTTPPPGCRAASSSRPPCAPSVTSSQKTRRRSCEGGGGSRAQGWLRNEGEQLLLRSRGGGHLPLFHQSGAVAAHPAGRRAMQQQGSNCCSATSGCCWCHIHGGRCCNDAQETGSSSSLHEQGNLRAGFTSLGSGTPSAGLVGCQSLLTHDNTA